jgi:hypothetical protein
MGERNLRSMRTIFAVSWLLIMGVFLVILSATIDASRVFMYVTNTIGVAFLLSSVVLLTYEIFIKREMIQLTREVIGLEKSGVRIREMRPYSVAELIQNRIHYTESIDICGFSQLLDPHISELMETFARQKINIRVLTINPELRNLGIIDEGFNIMRERTREIEHVVQHCKEIYGIKIELRQCDMIPLALVITDSSVFVSMYPFTFESRWHDNILFLEVDRYSRSYATYKFYFESLWDLSRKLPLERSNEG